MHLLLAVLVCVCVCFVFFSILSFFFHKHSRFTGQQGKEEVISLTPLYHFHQLLKHLDISRAIVVKSLFLHIASSRARTGNLWFPSSSPQPLSYEVLVYKPCTYISFAKLTGATFWFPGSNLFFRTVFKHFYVIVLRLRRNNFIS